MHKPNLRTRFLTVVAQDPGIRTGNGKILTAEVSVPAEELAPGPRGYRVHMVDFDTSVHTFYKPRNYPSTDKGRYRDPYENPSNGTILEDPRFHAQNVYAYHHAHSRAVRICFRTANQLEFFRPPAQSFTACVRRCQCVLFKTTRSACFLILSGQEGDNFLVSLA